MSTDNRELILAQLAVLLGQIDGVTVAARNLEEISEVPPGGAIAVLYDGDELATDNVRAIGGVGNVVHMTPEIVLSLGEVPETVGTSTNEWRAKLLKKILLDPTLANLSAKDIDRNCGPRYLGCSTSLHPGRATQVMLTAHFTIGYPFVPTAL
jgi:hypothetical protein